MINEKIYLKDVLQSTQKGPIFYAKDSPFIPIMLKGPISESQSETRNSSMLEVGPSEWVVEFFETTFYDSKCIQRLLPNISVLIKVLLAFKNNSEYLMEKNMIS